MTLQPLPGPIDARLAISVPLRLQRINKSCVLVVIDAQRAPPTRLHVKLAITSRVQASPAVLTVQLDVIATGWMELSVRLVLKGFIASSTQSTPINTPVLQEHTV
jgi:hypothetical protein